MANNVQFGLTLANRGVVIGVTTVEQMLQMSEIADTSSVYDWVWVGDSILPNLGLKLWRCSRLSLHAPKGSRWVPPVWPVWH